jgi:hypothetical protein
MNAVQRQQSSPTQTGIAPGRENFLTKTIQHAWAIVKEFRRTYIALNLIYYGLVVVAMIYVAFNPSLQRSLLQTVGTAFTQGAFASVGNAYGSGQVIVAMLLTFVLNLMLGSFLVITLPSLLIPFSGLLMGICRAILWGLLLSPTTPQLALTMIPHSLTLILEGQGYILAMLAAYVQGKAFLWPRTLRVATRWQGYKAGVKRSVQLYLLVILVLAIAAIYEAIEVILLARLFR